MSLRETKKQQTRAAIVKAATRLFKERGYESTRTKDIAAEAGIATGTLFNYAATKNDVVVLMWEQRVSALVGSALAAGAAEEDPVDAMVAVFRPIFAFYSEDLALGRRFLQAVMFDPSTTETMRSLNEGFVMQLSVLLSGTHHPMMAAMNVFSAYYSVLTMLLAGRLTQAHAEQTLRALLMVQQKGW